MKSHSLQAHDVGLRAEVSESVDAFRRILRALRLSARTGERSTGLSPAQHFVLSMLAEQPGASVNDIAAATLTDRSSAASMIERLVERGLATRERSATDRRRAVISISSTGRRALRSGAPAPTTQLIAGLKRLRSDERVALAKGLSALTRAMGIHREPAGMLFEDHPHG
jgi:DNA-binding MarR family transcriptional regulator